MWRNVVGPAHVQAELEQRVWARPASEPDLARAPVAALEQIPASGFQECAEILLSGAQAALILVATGWEQEALQNYVVST